MGFSCSEWVLASNIFLVCFSLPADRPSYVRWLFVKFIALHLSAYLKAAVTQRHLSQPISCCAGKGMSRKHGVKPGSQQWLARVQPPSGAQQNRFHPYLTWAGKAERCSASRLGFPRGFTSMSWYSSRSGKYVRAPLQRTDVPLGTRGSPDRSWPFHSVYSICWRYIRLLEEFIW